MAKKTTQGIDVDRLNQEVLDLGVRVKIYKSTPCPNMKSLESFDHDVNCDLCNNFMVDFDPVNSIALFQQQDFKESFKVLGTYHIDEVLVTFLSGVTLQMHTKIELLDFEEDFFELMQRNEFATTDTDILKYKACQVVGVFAKRSGALVRFHEGADFELDQNGNIKWVGTNRPTDKEIYSIYYRYKPVYRAVKAVHRERFSQFNNRPDGIQAPKKQVGDGNTYVKLPETWVLKRDYLIERRDQDGNPIPPNPLFDPNA